MLVMRKAMQQGVAQQMFNFNVAKGAYNKHGDGAIFPTLKIIFSRQFYSHTEFSFFIGWNI